jgi:LuxR family transcriptional regulator, maltose regulon positive regulatory protein
MAMTFSFHENIDYAETAQSFEITNSVSNYSSVSDERIHLFAEKMRIPRFSNQISRPRLVELLEKSTKQNGATLITGRAETGKSALAAGFAENYKHVAWYQIDAAETDWKIFSRYFATVLGEDYEDLKYLSRDILVFVEKLLLNVAQKHDEPLLIVLDDIHNIFDAEWFAEFFVSLLYSLTPEMHLVLLSRTKPPQPLWRVRSKQVLGVIDEKLLAFNVDETEKIFKKHGISIKLAAHAHEKSFGRISRLNEFIARLSQM